MVVPIVSLVRPGDRFCENRMEPSAKYGHEKPSDGGLSCAEPCY